MPPTAPTVLVTRPEPDAAETAARVSALGMRPILSPALARRRLERAVGRDFAGAQAAVLTSAAAARALAEDLSAPGAPTAFCVGARTAAAAREAGFGAVIAGPGEAQGLLERLKELDRDVGPLVVLRGREVAFDLAAALRSEGYSVRERSLYATEFAPLSEPARQALRAAEAQAALFLSARTVAAFVAAAQAAGLSGALGSVTAVCNSARTAAPAGRSGLFAGVDVAAAPTLEATLSCLSATVSAQG